MDDLANNSGKDKEINSDIEKKTKSKVVNKAQSKYKKNKTLKVSKKTSSKQSSKKELKMKSKYYLDSVNLSISSTQNKPSVNTDKLNYSYYKPSIISVRNSNGIIESKDMKKIKNKDLSDVVDKYIDKYGKDIVVSINFDGYSKNGSQVSKNIGWANVAKVYVDKNKTNKEKIRDLKELRSSLKKNSSSKAKTKVYKKI
jgi:hypothetical protein